MKSIDVGNSFICGWQVAPKTVWIQSRSAKLARKLARRADARLVAVGVAGGFLRIFEFQRSMSWATRLIERYLSTKKVTNEGNSSLKPSPLIWKLANDKSHTPDGLNLTSIDLDVSSPAAMPVGGTGEDSAVPKTYNCLGTSILSPGFPKTDARPQDGQNKSNIPFSKTNTN